MFKFPDVAYYICKQKSVAVALLLCKIKRAAGEIQA